MIGTSTHACEQRSGPDRLRPTPKRSPTIRCAESGRRPRADAGAHAGDRRVEESPQRQRQGDRRPRVQPAIMDRPWRRSDHRGAGLAAITAHLQADDHRSIIWCCRSPLLAVLGAVAVQHLLAARRSARHPTRRTRGRPGVVNAGQLLQPGLAIDHASHQVCFVHACSEHDERGDSVEKNTPRSSLFSLAEDRCPPRTCSPLALSTRCPPLIHKLSVSPWTPSKQIRAARRWFSTPTPSSREDRRGLLLLILVRMDEGEAAREHRRAGAGLRGYTLRGVRANTKRWWMRE